MNNDGDRQELLDQLEHLKALGERACRDLFEVSGPASAVALAREAHNCLCEAITLAHRLELDSEVARLDARLGELHAAFRAQFRD